MNESLPSADKGLPADKREQGLHEKFRVERLTPSTRGINHDDCRYFVLDPQHDPIAQAALARYAQVARAEGFGPLADDLEAWLARVTTPRCPSCNDLGGDSSGPCWDCQGGRLTRDFPPVEPERCVICAASAPRHGGLCCSHRYDEQPPCDRCPTPPARGDQ